MNPFGPSFVEPKPPLYALSQGERPLALGTQPNQLIFWLELHGIAGAEAPAPILQQTRAVLAMVCGAATATARKNPCGLAARNNTSYPFGVRSESTRVAWVLIGASVLCAHMSTALLPWFNLQSRGTILLPEHGDLFNLRPDFSPMVIACASPDPAPCLHRCCTHLVGTRDAGTIARKCTPFPSRKMLAWEAPRAGSCNTLSTTLHT